MTDNVDTKEDIKTSLLILKRKFENEILLNKYCINYIDNIIKKDNSDIDKNELFLCVIMLLIIASILSYLVKK